MFIAVNMSKNKSGKVYRSVLLRESYREGKKVKKRTIANLSNWSEEKIQAFASALKNTDKTFINKEDFNLIQGRSIGSVHLLFVIAQKARHRKRLRRLLSCKTHTLVNNCTDPRTRIQIISNPVTFHL